MAAIAAISLSHQPLLTIFGGIAYVGYAFEPSRAHFEVALGEAARHEAGSFAHLEATGCDEGLEFDGFDKGVIVVDAGGEAATGEVFAVPDEDGSRQKCAVDGVEDEDAAGGEDASDLFDGLLEVLYVFQHVEADDDREAAVGVGERFGVALLVVNIVA